VFTQKFHADGSFECYKGRLVAQGFNQRPGFEYLEVFAPTVRLPTLYIILALAALLVVCQYLPCLSQWGDRLRCLHGAARRIC